MEDPTSVESTYIKVENTLPHTAIDTFKLIKVPWNAHSNRRLHSDLATSEYVARCPWSGMPDFAQLAIRYQPQDHLLEMKSLKMYITSFMDVGITMEEACQRICDDISAVIKPHWLEVQMSFSARGGYTNTVTMRYYA